MKRRWPRRLAWVMGLAFSGVLALLWFAPHLVFPSLAHFLDVSEPPQRTDYVLVLNGDPQTRPFAAAALVKAGLARKVLLTQQKRARESAAVQDGIIPTELQLTQRVLERRGVPENSMMVLPGEIENTVDEAETLAEFMKEHPGETVSVVTSGFHTRRARRLFARALGERVQQVHFVGVPRDGVEEASWWRTRAGWVIYGNEYAKLLYYSVR